MPNFGIGIAIFSNHKILLTQREDFESWCLPGGMVEAGESLAQTALREVREETGLEVCIERLVGIYSIPSGPNGGAHEVIFAGSPIGGTLHPDPNEVIAAEWFALNEVPDLLNPWTLRQVRDGFSGVGGSAAWRQEYSWPFPPETRRRDLYRIRDESGLTRADFFRKHFLRGAFTEVLEVELDDKDLDGG